MIKCSDLRNSPFSLKSSFVDNNSTPAKTLKKSLKRRFNGSSLVPHGWPISVKVDPSKQNLSCDSSLYLDSVDQKKISASLSRRLFVQLSFEKNKIYFRLESEFIRAS